MARRATLAAEAADKDSHGWDTPVARSGRQHKDAEGSLNEQVVGRVEHRSEDMPAHGAELRHMAEADTLQSRPADVRSQSKYAEVGQDLCIQVAVGSA